MVKLKFDDKEYHLVSSWDEMTEKQFTRACHIRAQHLGSSTQVALNASRIILFQILSDVPSSKVNEIAAFQWVDILPYLNFVFETPILSKNPIQKISTGFFRNLYGPSGMLDHSTYEEMISADTYFVKASNEMNSDMMYMLFSILWRPERSDLKTFKRDPSTWNGDIREPFNSTLAKSRVEQYKKSIPFHYVVGCFIYYWAFRQSKMIAAFPNIFKKPNPTGKKVERSGNDYGWAGQLLEMSGKQFGDYHSTKNQHWRTILIEQSRQIDISNERALKSIKKS